MATRGPITLGGVALTSCGLTQNGSIMVVAQCGQLSVLEDPSKPAGRRIDLRVAVIPAESPTPAADALFALTGGPGGAATSAMAWTARTFVGVHATRDIVLVDQRGTGASNPIRFGDAPDVSGLSASAAAAKLQAWVAGQVAAMNADPGMYTTAVAMDDLDAVRAALGYDKIDLYGASYGATAAQYYIRQHGDHLRAVVLDGATLIEVPVLELIAPNSQRALNLLFLRCQADKACAASFPDLAGDMARAMTRLAKGDVKTDVVSTISASPIIVSTQLFSGVVHQGLVQSDLAARLPMLIHAAGQGRWHDVGVAIRQVEQPPEVGTLAMSAAIRCAEHWAVFDPGRTATNGANSYLRTLEVALATSQAQVCQLAPPAYVPANDAAPATTDVPVLFVLGEADPQDPPSNIANAGVDFPHSLEVIVPGEGHTVGHLGCVPSIIDAFITAGSLPGLDTSCVSAMTPPAFQLP